MRQYKLLIMGIIGVLITSSVIVGYHIWDSNKKQVGYHVDGGYIPKVESPEAPSSTESDTKQELSREAGEVDPQSNNQDVTVIESTDKATGNTVDNDPSDHEIPASKPENPQMPSKDVVKKPEAVITGHSWVDKTINQNRADIDDADLEEGLSIGDKIDDDILLGYLDGGLTDEERVDLKEYLEVVLAPEEMVHLNVLFQKYAYMFQ